MDWSEIYFGGKGGMLYGCWNDIIDDGMQIQGNPSNRHGFVALRGMSLLDIMLFLGLWGPLAHCLDDQDHRS